MSAETRPKHKVEMTFFKNAQIYYNSALEDCGNIRRSLSRLKKKLEESMSPTYS